ncbi:MAG: hypothetical protein MOGMAGMI_00752 [Candidatus Omnitrophica bacterium]|nr:hypothetical protein [Candidatus Omnitrophota bacterium]
MIRALSLAGLGLAFGLTTALAEPLPKPDFELPEAGESYIDYARYGVFEGSGTKDYVYRVTDPAGLAMAAGAGVYPSIAHQADPQFQYFVSAQGPDFSVWSYSGSRYPQNDFYAWCMAETDEGARLFFAGEALRRAGHIRQALKAYHALVVHFPRTAIWSKDKSFYWYAAPEAIARMHKLLAAYPDLGLRLEDAFVDVRRSGQLDPATDEVLARPGRLVPDDLRPIAREYWRVKQERGKGRVRLVQYDNGHWEMLVEGRPFVVKGVTYTATTIGESPHALNLRPWMTVDDNKNGLNDGMFDAWVDWDRDGQQDEGEKAVGDAELLRRMGANAIRIYHGVDEKGLYDPREYDKALMRKLNKEYGIHFIMGDFVGAYTVGSQARWDIGTDYTDPEQIEIMKRSVRDMVMDHKDEPYVLFWLLGNENQHPHTRTNAVEHPEAYARFLNETARMIHEIDPDHPVAVGNLNTSYMREIGQHAPEIDIYGANVYSGAYSMGSVWHQARELLDRPVVITEMGCDVYAAGRGVDEEAQADYFRQNWADVVENLAGGRGIGNALGAVQFEWMDEWWKTSKGDSWGNPKDHDSEGDFEGPFPDGWMHEEWLGIWGQGEGSDSPRQRHPRKIYDEIRRAWASGGQERGR